CTSSRLVLIWLAVVPGSRSAPPLEPQALSATARAAVAARASVYRLRRRTVPSLENTLEAIFALHLSSSSDREPRGEGARQPGLADGGRGGVEVVGGGVEARGPLLGVELEPGRPRVAVARLADAAGIEQPGAVVDPELGAVARLGAGRISPPLVPA